MTLQPNFSNTSSEEHSLSFFSALLTPHASQLSSTLPNSITSLHNFSSESATSAVSSANNSWFISNLPHSHLATLALSQGPFHSPLEPHHGNTATERTLLLTRPLRLLYLFPTVLSMYTPLLGFFLCLFVFFQFLPFHDKCWEQHLCKSSTLL